jgi:hypothetical protein
VAAERLGGIRARRRPTGGEPGRAGGPIACLAKVMTAYLTLKDYLLSGAQDGFTITVAEG